MHENSKEKIPDCLVDFCKHFSVNQWLQVKDCTGPVMEFFSFLQFVKHTLFNIFKKAVGPGILQTFSTSLM